MKRLAILVLLSAIWPVSANAQGLPQPGDFYLISRNADGEFVGSHKIFHRPSPGLRLVTYCNREYWVRPYTVAWTQLEVERRREVRVEFNRSKGWRPICEQPEQQVTLKDLGIEIAPGDVTDEIGEPEPLATRFSAIGNAFRK
ncbi:hypothetical protein [Roseibium aggregatum]|uniref:Uncharacterized protein n=1 Tax=Roseibium aggregatum TaxID=187304 RepID=A0A926S5U4_9HYPH|nr:hypothetical protein [Roseibium aggregatum]MBD1545767.1 hypothetical protein [Roseibium aggregatum]